MSEKQHFKNAKRCIKALWAYRAELNWRGLVFNELTNGQAVMRHGRYRLTVSVTVWP